MSANDPPDPEFSDSDRAWFDRLGARDPLGPPSTPAAIEGELLRAALARRRARQAAAESQQPDTLFADPGDGTEFADDDQRRRWQQLLAHLDDGPAADTPDQAQPEPGEPRPPLRPTAAEPVPPRWRWSWAGGGALAAAVVAMLVLVQRPGDEARIYDEPPGLGERGDTTVQRLPVAQPRLAAEALHAALRQAGEPAALHQRGRVFIVLLQVSTETTPQARAALAAAGVTAPPGPLRIEFEPR